MPGAKGALGLEPGYSFTQIRQMESKERWEIVGDSGGEMSQRSFKPEARIIVYLDR